MKAQKGLQALNLEGRSKIPYPMLLVRVGQVRRSLPSPIYTPAWELQRAGGGSDPVVTWELQYRLSHLIAC